MELYVYVNYICYETEWEVQNITGLEVTCPEVPSESVNINEILILGQGRKFV